MCLIEKLFAFGFSSVMAPVSQVQGPPANLGRFNGGCDDWCDEEVERDRPIHDVSVGKILEGALGIEAAKWSRGARSPRISWDILLSFRIFGCGDLSVFIFGKKW